MHLITERLIIRPLEMSDVSALVALFSDSEVMRFSFNGVKSLPQIEQWVKDCALKNYECNGFGQYGVALKATGELIGVAGFFIQKIDLAPDNTLCSTADGARQVELAYRLMRSHWGSGYATEAARALAEYARTSLALPFLVSIIHLENNASARVVEKVGMKLLKNITMHGDAVGIYGIELLPSAHHQASEVQQLGK